MEKNNKEILMNMIDEINKSNLSIDQKDKIINAIRYCLWELHQNEG
jgi:tRNA A37 threonylcarbamoyladenosine modification protein TsaB